MDGDKKEQVVVFSEKKRFHLPKLGWPFNQFAKIPKKVAVIITVIVIFVIGGIYAKYSYDKNKITYNNQCVGSDKSPIYAEASKVINPAASSKLAVVVSKIMTMRNYDSDPSCLFVIVTYNVNTGDSANARIYYDKLTKVYSSKKGFVKPLGSTDTFQTLGYKVQYAEKLTSQYNTNSHFFNPK